MLIDDKMRLLEFLVVRIKELKVLHKKLFKALQGFLRNLFEVLNNRVWEGFLKELERGYLELLSLRLLLF